MDHRRKKKIVKSVLNFKRVTHFRLCMFETQAEVPRSLPSVTPSGKGVYLTLYPLCCPNSDTAYVRSQLDQ